MVVVVLWQDDKEQEVRHRPHIPQRIASLLWAFTFAL